jgi:hypothetical protein
VGGPRVAAWGAVARWRRAGSKERAGQPSSGRYSVGEDEVITDWRGTARLQEVCKAVPSHLGALTPGLSFPMCDEGGALCAVPVRE